MWYCFHEQDIGIDNFEGQGSANNNLNELRTGKSGLIYVIYMKVKKSQALNAAILRGLHFTSSHKTMENNETQSPTNTWMRGWKKLCRGLLWHSHLGTCQAYCLYPALLPSLQPIGDIWTIWALSCTVIVTFDFLVTNQIINWEKLQHIALWGCQQLSKAINQITPYNHNLVWITGFGNPCSCAWFC